MYVSPLEEEVDAHTPQQVLSVKFMIEQEKNNRMKGGILAGEW